VAPLQKSTQSKRGTDALRDDLRKLRRRMQILFQDPYSSLDPRAPVGNSIAEGLRVHGITDASKQHAKVGQILDRVGL
jgi:ABC-type microcin C transport system duplicated ATPase subunit YejF